MSCYGNNADRPSPLKLVGSLSPERGTPVNTLRYSELPILTGGASRFVDALTITWGICDRYSAVLMVEARSSPGVSLRPTGKAPPILIINGQGIN